MDYFEEQEKKLRKAFAKRRAMEDDYFVVWSNCVEHKTGFTEVFGETDLSKVIQVLDKLQYVAPNRPSSRTFTTSWPKDILLDKDFLNFAKKFDEKILDPVSDLIGEIKSRERQSLLFSNACCLNRGLYEVLDLYSRSKTEEVDWNETKNRYSEYYAIHHGILEFLSEINKGTPPQKLECIAVIDRLLDEHQEVRQALSKYFGSDEPMPFIDMIDKTLKDNMELEHLSEFHKIIDMFNTKKDLESSLGQKNVEKPKKLKL